MKMKNVLIKNCAGEIGLFKDGDWVESKDQDPNGEVRLIQMADIGINKFMNKSNKYLTNETFEKLKCTALRTGDLLISRMPDPIGRTCIFEEDSRKCATVVDVTILRTDPSITNNRWLMYKLNSPEIRNKILSRATGTTRKRISRKNLGNIQINIPNVSTQMRIVEILDKAQELIDLRKKQIELLDELIKSIFYDMFGDPVINSKEFNIKKVKDIVEDKKNAIKAGPFGSALKKEYYVEKGYKIYGQEQVIRDDLNYGDYYIDEKRYKKLETCKIETGDILISTVGTFGKISVVPEIFEPGIINPRLVKIALDKLIMVPMFFKMLLSSDAMVKKIKSKSHGGTMGIINSTKIKNLDVIVPNLKLQKQFIDKVQKVEEQKELMQESLTEMENNFNSLMQKAFKGELFS